MNYNQFVTNIKTIIVSLWKKTVNKLFSLYFKLFLHSFNFKSMTWSSVSTYIFPWLLRRFAKAEERKMRKDRQSNEVKCEKAKDDIANGASINSMSKKFEILLTTLAYKIQAVGIRKKCRPGPEYILRMC